ncbi:MAG TPA: hypothetical protein VF213_06875 [Dongiaceae bacterium]
MSVLRKRGCDDPISIEDEDDPRYDGEAGTGRSLAGHRRALGRQGSGV